jgi:ABC-type dipeptide/oligopeptide/nickel transport system permease component
MLRYIARRVFLSIPVLIASSVLVYVVVRANGDFLRVLTYRTGVDPKAIAKTRHQLGLDRSGATQYLACGSPISFGASGAHRCRPASPWSRTSKTPCGTPWSWAPWRRFSR